MSDRTPNLPERQKKVPQKSAEPCDDPCSSHPVKPPRAVSQSRAAARCWNLNQLLGLAQASNGFWPSPIFGKETERNGKARCPVLRFSRVRLREVVYLAAGQFSVLGSFSGQRGRLNRPQPHCRGLPPLNREPKWETVNQRSAGTAKAPAPMSDAGRPRIQHKTSVKTRDRRDVSRSGSPLD